MSRIDRFRLLVLALATFFFFSLLVVQFFRVQILQEKKWKDRAENQHYFAVSEPFMRGRFFTNASLKQGHYDSDQLLVIDIQKFHLYVDPYAIKEHLRDEIASQLIELSHVPEEDSEAFRKQFDYDQSRSRKLCMWLERDTQQEIREWWSGYSRKHRMARNAIFFIKDYQRSYPFGNLLGQVIHTIRENKEERTKQAIPTGGLEFAFNDVLKGKLGERRMMRSPRNAFATGEVIEEPQDGADVYLTINHYLQAIAEEEVAKGVRRMNAKAGWAVMMDPFTGEIYALAQYPHFNPARYTDYFNDPDLIDHTKVKAVTDAYEPGSVMKPITVAVALHANACQQKKGLPPIFDPEEQIDTLDGRFPGRSKPISDTHTHRCLNMNMGVQKSSNIYMGRLIQRVVDTLGNQWYRNTLSDVFGFGRKTGIELPVESVGLLPTPGKQYANGRLEWSVPTPFSLAMGYNLQVNSLQMLRAWAVLANGGHLVTPTLIRKVVRGGEGKGEEGILLDNTLPERVASFPRVLDEKITRRVVQAMKYVTKSYGSARRGNIPGYTEAGKTGTSMKLEGGQYTSSKHIASFIGFAPADHPRLILLVVIDESPPSLRGNQYGGVAAAPVFGAIAKRSLEYLGVAPDDPYGYPTGDPRSDPDLADWSSEIKQLQEKYKTWNDEP